MSTKVTINALINAPIEKVWEHWTNPTHIVNWNFAGEDWHCPNAENDLRIGGKYFSRMEAKDGSFGFDFIAIYDEIVTNDTITYTMEDGRKATTTFIKNGATTAVSTVFDAEQENSIELQQQGWQMILNNFKSYIERSI